MTTPTAATVEPSRHIQHALSGRRDGSPNDSISTANLFKGRLPMAKETVPME
ncbi:hypothetical protein FRC16_005877, partial [Serendipita sp. 398]